MCMTDLASYSLMQWQFWQLTLKWLSGVRAQDKNEQCYCCFLFFFFWFLFNYAIQGKSITWLVNSTSNCTWKPISHSFRVQFNVEFPRRVINFPIEPRLLFGKRIPRLFFFERFVYLRLIAFLQRKSTVSLAPVSVVTYHGSCFNSPLKRKAAILHPTVHFVSSTFRTQTFIWQENALPVCFWNVYLW